MVAGSFKYSRNNFKIKKNSIKILTKKAVILNIIMSEEGQIFLSAIIINYNGGDFLRRTLSSLETELASLGENSEVIVVDNASTDDSLTLVSRAFPQVRIISLPENLGFARAANRGARASFGLYLLFLNNDIEIKPGCLSRLTTFLASHPEYALVAPAVFNPDGSFQLSFGLDLNFFSEFFLKYFARGYFALINRILPSRMARDIDWASGVACLLRRQPFFEIGGFDERYFLYLEDADLGLRLRQAGYKIRYLPEAKIVHFRGAIASQYPQLALIGAKKGQLLYYSLHNRPQSFIWLKRYLLIKFHLKNLLAWLSGDSLKSSIYSEIIKEIKGFRREANS